LKEICSICGEEKTGCILGDYFDEQGHLYKSDCHYYCEKCERDEETGYFYSQLPQCPICGEKKWREIKEFIEEVKKSKYTKYPFKRYRLYLICKICGSRPNDYPFNERIIG